MVPGPVPHAPIQKDAQECGDCSVSDEAEGREENEAEGGAGGPQAHGEGAERRGRGRQAHGGK
eukprot:46177-Eustigmatos_ZCMA.PRE.1